MHGAFLPQKRVAIAIGSHKRMVKCEAFFEGSQMHVAGKSEKQYFFVNFIRKYNCRVLLLCLIVVRFTSPPDSFCDGSRSGNGSRRRRP